MQHHNPSFPHNCSDRLFGYPVLTELSTLIVGISIMLLGLLLAWGSGRSLWAYELVAFLII